MRLLHPRHLRGEAKLSAALDAFELDVTGTTVVDAGAGAGGFTTALLRRGATRVYAVDVGFGQLSGSLRANLNVIILERTNIADLEQVIPDVIDLVTMDLSYLSIAKAVRSLDALSYAAGARLIALVKPRFELRASTVVTDSAAVRHAVGIAAEAAAASGWQPLACTIPAATGSNGAVEAFVVATRVVDLLKDHTVALARWRSNRRAGR